MASREISDGDTHYLSSQTDFLSGDTAYTLMFWAKRTGTLDLDALWNLRHANNSGNSISIGYWYTGDNGLLMQQHHVTESANTTYATGLSSSITSTNWNHYAITWNGSDNRAKVYVNAVDLTTAGSAGLGPRLTSSNLRIGFGASGYNTSFRVAHVEFYTSVFTAQQITHSMYWPGTIGGASWKLHWPVFGVDDPEVDWSGNGETASVNGTCAASDDGPPVSIGAVIPVRQFVAAAPAATANNLTLLGVG